MSVFNQNNKGHETKKYPLFLGEDLGLFDTINTTYPELEELYQIQIAQIWNELEVDMSQDSIDLLSLDPVARDILVRTISWQHLADSIASKSISGLLMPYVTNSELEGLVNVWSLFETIHARTYSHIVKQIFEDPQQMLLDTYNDVQAIERSGAIQKGFEQLENLPKNATKKEQARAILLALGSLFALEAIAFMDSFAVTFAVGELKKVSGTVQNVKLIARDEMLHTRFGHNILRIIMEDKELYPDFHEVWDDVLPEIKAVFDAVVDQEVSWSEMLFDGKSIIGLNAKRLADYTYYMAKPAYDVFGFEWTYPLVEENPLPYMDNYLDGSNFQTAAQEMQITSYRIGATHDDVSDAGKLVLDIDYGI